MYVTHVNWELLLKTVVKINRFYVPYVSIIYDYNTSDSQTNSKN